MYFDCVLHANLYASDNSLQTNFKLNAHPWKIDTNT